ncbi:MAG: hypothetical protein BWY76_00138 [bacterium ADurb.Bin429]|nr:MAG: hypothetical protein BWY76_00138 [bacterium ADurb.Bin429]
MGEDHLQHTEFHGELGLDFDTIAFSVLSAILATIALLTGSVPVLIGAMILSPTFDPLVAIPFGLVRRDWALLLRGLGDTLAQFVLIFVVCSLVVVVWVRMPYFQPEQNILGAELLRERLHLTWAGVLTALAAGAGGALAFASERRLHLVGVVIAIALVPTLAAAAIAFFGSGLPGWGGLALFAVNIGGIIVAGYLILTFRSGAGRAKSRLTRARHSTQD